MVLQGNVEMRLHDYPSALESFRTAADLAPGISGAPADLAFSSAGSILPRARASTVLQATGFEKPR